MVEIDCYMRQNNNDCCSFTTCDSVYVDRIHCATLNSASARIGGIGRLSDARRTIACALAERDSNGCFCGGAIRHSTNVDVDILFLRY